MAKILVSVARAIISDPTTKAVIAYGDALMTSTFTLDMANTEIRGGVGNILLSKYFNTKNLTLSIQNPLFQEAYLAMQLGTTVANGTVNAAGVDIVTLDGSGNGTVSKSTVVGSVNVLKEDGSIVVVVPTGQNISVPSAANQCVKLLYQYTTTADYIAISATTPPKVVTIDLIAELRDKETGVLVQYLNITVDRAQLNGTVTLDMASDSTSNIALEASALGTYTTCGEQSYGTIKYINVVGTTTYAYIIASPSAYNPTAGVLSTQQLSVYGARGGVYGNVNLTASATYTKLAGGDSDITVSSGGLVTVAATSSLNDQATIEVSFNDGVTNHKDYVVVKAV